jgi:hypothetical protein
MHKIKLYTCVNNTKGREYVGLSYIIDAWEESGHIERIPIDMLNDGRHISWVGRIGGLALEPSDVTRISIPYEYVLACQYWSAWKSMPRVLPWNFYSRHWPSYRQVKSELPLPRTAKTIFSGTIRPNSGRSKWMNSTEIFGCRTYGTFRGNCTKFDSLVSYYRALASTYHGLCPVGDSPVTQREIETMGLGCVPIFTEGVEWLYAHPVQEGVHFHFAKDPIDLQQIIDNFDIKVWTEMSHAGQQYFDNHCSPEGLWKTVLETIERYNIKL